ncbi:MAG: DUF1697 domain-containing protein [Spirochaetales bacterium]|nr:DUF1697 domain-containing protein [Spirochaetales bacterium]
MNTYISILRGINVSGKNIIKMADLKQLYETLGFMEVQTYIQSGNVIFRTKEQNIITIEKTIKEHIITHFGYDIPVLVIKSEKLKKIVETLPFTDIDTTKLHVTFLSNKCINPPLDQIIEKKASSELVHFTEEAVYIFCPDGYGKTKLSNNFLEKKLKVSATTRNWKTVNKLLELALNNI